MKMWKSSLLQTLVNEPRPFFLNENYIQLKHTSGHLSVNNLNVSYHLSLLEGLAEFIFLSCLNSARRMVITVKVLLTITIKSK